MSDLRQSLMIGEDSLRQINELLLDPGSEVINELLRIVEKHGGPEQINAKAVEARKPANLLERLKKSQSPYVADIEWLTGERDRGAFISIADYRKKVLGERAGSMTFDAGHAVTLEISALQFFPWLIAEAKQAIRAGEVMPGRYIRVRNMAEQVEDQGDTLAVAAAMQIVGASYVETLDTKGTDGSNIHLGGPATITGYFGGVGQPNEHALQWVDEFLGYYTEYGIRQVLNINPGTVLLGYLLHKLGIDIEFKISVYMGNDNPYAALWTLYSHESCGSVKEDELLWGLFRWRRSAGGPKHLSVFPLFAVDRAAGGAGGSWSLLKGLVGYERAGEKKTFRVLYFLKF